MALSNAINVAFRLGRAVGVGATAVVGVGAIATGISAFLNRNSTLNLLGDSAFPTDLENYRHYITFEFSEYQRRSIFTRAFYSGKGSIRLPIPANLVDQQSVSYEETPTNLLQGAGAEMGLRVGGAAGGAAGAVGGGAVSGAVTSALSGIGGGILGGAAAAVPQALQMFGIAVNPFLTVLFKSPTFKRHSFAWRLSPNSPQESTVLNNILTKFKYHMLPALGDNVAGAILKYPDICNVKIFPNDSWLYKFKPCVVESISINYAPNGNPSFFNGTDAPSDVQFTVNLLEIEYWLKDDFQGGPLGGFGFPS